jgi:hypothetical protein
MRVSCLLVGALSFAAVGCGSTQPGTVSVEAARADAAVHNSAVGSSPDAAVDVPDAGRGAIKQTTAAKVCGKAGSAITVIVAEDLDALSDCTSLAGDLMILGADLASLTGLERVEPSFV